MTVEALFRQVNAFLEDDMVVIADTGDALFGAEDLYIHNSVHFLAPAYYCSLGFAVPAALGVKAAKPDLRPLVLVGDGAFQMSGMEVASHRPLRPEPDHHRARQSTAMAPSGRCSTAPSTTWPPGTSGRSRRSWAPGSASRSTTEIEMDAALKRARANTASVSIIQVMLDRNDHSPALLRLTADARRARPRQGVKRRSAARMVRLAITSRAF